MKTDTKPIDPQIVMMYLEVIMHLQKQFDISDEIMDEAFDHAEQEVAKKIGKTLN